MLLSDRDIRFLLSSGKLISSPEIEDAAIQPASVDIRLGTTWLRTAPGRPVMGEWVREERDTVTLMPGEFALASSIENFVLPRDIAGRMEGKSSWGRRGLIVHSTAGFFDPGFQGTATLEMHNIAPWPLELWAGMYVAQMSFLQLSSEAKRPYGSPGVGHYQGQSGPTPARNG